MTSNMQDKKVCIIIDSSLASGLVANAVAVLALTLGSRVKSLIGPELQDADGSSHTGITTIPVPILAANSEILKQIRNKAASDDSDMIIVDFSDCAQQTLNYNDYADLLKKTTSANIVYLGVALYGPRKQVQSLTGNLSLLR